jgi:hypothetical protein
MSGPPGIGWSLDPLSDKQREIVASIKYHRKVFAIGGKRSGKSTACAFAAAKLTWRWAPGRNGLMFAPTEAQLKDLNIDKWKQVAPPHLYEIKADGDKEKGPHILCYHPQPNGPALTSTIYLRTEKAAARIEGLTVAWAYGEEIQDCPISWSLAQDRLSDKDAEHLVLFGAGIPENGWLEDEHQTFADGHYRPDTDAVWVHCRTLDNELYLPETYVRDQAANLTEEEFAMRSDGLFVKASGTIHPGFSRAVHIQPWQFHPGRKLWIGKDFNIDPQTAVMAQDDVGCLRFLDEHEMRNASTPDHAAALVEWCKARDIDHEDPEQVQIIPDATGKARGRETFDLSSAHAILRRAGFSLSVPSENPRRTNRDETVNWALRSKDGKVRVTFDPRCKKTIKAISGAKQQGRDLPTNELSHWDDCVGYVVHRRYPVRGEEPPPEGHSVSRKTAARKWGKRYPM